MNEIIKQLKDEFENVTNTVDVMLDKLHDFDREAGKLIADEVTSLSKTFNRVDALLQEPSKQDG